VPVIMLTARDADTDIARALEAGADDYVTKPFSPIELMARMNAVIRRTQVAPAGRNGAPIVAGDITLDLGAHAVWVKGDQVKLTPIEFELLAQLARSPGKVVCYKELLTSVWGPEYTTAINYLKVHMQRLRRKITPDPDEPSPIQTEWKVGYKLAAIPGMGKVQPSSECQQP